MLNVIIRGFAYFTAIKNAQIEWNIFSQKMTFLSLKMKAKQTDSKWSFLMIRSF